MRQRLGTPAGDGGLQLAQHELGVRSQPGLQSRGVHGEKALVPDVGQIAVVRRRGHAGSGIESANVDLDIEEGTDDSRDALERQQAASAGDSEFDHLNGAVAQSFRQIRDGVDSIGIVRTVKDAIARAGFHRACRKRLPERADAGDCGQTG
jgi:hypothetical protein